MTESAAADSSTSASGGAAAAIGGIVFALAFGLGLAWLLGRGGPTLLGVPFTVVGMAAAFAVMWLVCIPCYLAQVEIWFDLTGTLAFLTLLGVALWAGGTTPHGVLLSALVAAWTLRLGIFLFRRITQDGGDGRWDDIKPHFWRFLGAWTLQGMWIGIMSAPAMVAIAAPAADLGPVAIIGLVLWIVGFTFEVVADAQKRIHRAQNPGRFIATGLWAWSRHPNYFGEILLWVGAAVIAAEVASGWQWVMLVTPLFSYVILMHASGVPMIEKRADDRWGDDPDYVAWRDATPVLLPRPPRS